MKIYAPVKNTNGVYASVRFVNGVGETDNPRLIDWFKTHGYSIEKCDDSSQNSYEKCDELDQNDENDELIDEDDEVEMMGYSEKEPDFEKMTPYELRDWMLAHGYNVRNTRSKDKLLEIIRG